MPRYFFHIAYNGTCYHGWQIQPDARSVQGEITSALTKLNGNDLVELVGCGRTDTGVHAAKYFFHADIDNISPEELKYKLNKIFEPGPTVTKVTILALFLVLLQMCMTLWWCAIKLLLSC